MADISKIKDIFGDVLPESHIFFATTANTEIPSYHRLRKHLGKTSAIVNRRAWLLFKVEYKNFVPPVIPVTSVTVSGLPATLDPGAIGKAIASILPVDATNKAVTWATSHPAVLSIDQQGNFAVLGTDGVDTEVTITATADGKSGTAKTFVDFPQIEEP